MRSRRLRSDLMKSLSPNFSPFNRSTNCYRIVDDLESIPATIIGKLSCGCPYLNPDVVEQRFLNLFAILFSLVYKPEIRPLSLSTDRSPHQEASSDTSY